MDVSARIGFYAILPSLVNGSPGPAVSPDSGANESPRSENSPWLPAISGFGIEQIAGTERENESESLDEDAEAGNEQAPTGSHS